MKNIPFSIIICLLLMLGCRNLDLIDSDSDYLSRAKSSLSQAYGTLTQKNLIQQNQLDWNNSYFVESSDKKLIVPVNRNIKFIDENNIALNQNTFLTITEDKNQGFLFQFEDYISKTHLNNKIIPNLKGFSGDVFYRGINGKMQHGYMFINGKITQEYIPVNSTNKSRISNSVVCKYVASCNFSSDCVCVIGGAYGAEIVTISTSTSVEDGNAFPSGCKHPTSSPQEANCVCTSWYITREEYAVICVDTTPPNPDPNDPGQGGPPSNPTYSCPDITFVDFNIFDINIRNVSFGNDLSTGKLYSVNGYNAYSNYSDIPRWMFRNGQNNFYVTFIGSWTTGSSCTKQYDFFIPFGTHI